MVGDDGFVTRASGEWAKDKLWYLSRYFSIFNGGMKDKWERRVGIDLMAGPGRCHVDGKSSDQFDGSTLLAFDADPGFTAILAVEADGDNAHALEQRLKARNNIGRARVRCSDCNAPAVIAEARDLLNDGLGVLFVDTLGLSDPAFSTVAQIVDGRRVDIVVTLMVHEFRRNLSAAMAGRAEHSSRFDRFFGTPEWRSRVADFEAGRYPAIDEVDALTDFYLEQLQSLGYGHTVALHRVMKNSKNAALYRLVYASRDPRGLDFWRKITQRPHSAQGELF